MLSLVLSLLLWSIDLNMYGNLRNTSSDPRRIRRLTNVILGRFGVIFIDLHVLFMKFKQTFG